MPAFSNARSLYLGTGSRLRRITSDQSIRISPLTAPYRSSAATNRPGLQSLPIPSLDHNREVHMFPRRKRVNDAHTLHPADRHVDATVDLAVPLPITIRSKVFL